MDIDGTFLPVAEELINNVFPTNITYIRSLGGGYDPSTGDVTQTTEEYAIKAGVLSRGRIEEGGVGETYELRLYVHHGATGMPHAPRTGDIVEYDGIQWKVTTIDPTYSSKGLIASKLTARAS